MLAKLSSQNQLTLPQEAVDAIGHASILDVAVDGDRLVLTPACLSAADAVRQRLAEDGITEADLAEAVRWARMTR